MKVFVIGGAGYKGSVLVPKLLAEGHEVVVYDLMIYGNYLKPHPNLYVIKGDVRYNGSMRLAAEDCTAAIHLACISNDPGCELNPELARAINYESFPEQIEACKHAGIERFIFASSSSVYGISDDPNVTEDHPRLPITDYNRYKAMCEDVLAAKADSGFHFTSIRPGTVCGASPRLRLDLTVNMFAAQAFYRGKITVFGGDQYRPNITIGDIADLYCDLLKAPLDSISGQAFNASVANLTTAEIADIVKHEVDRFDSILFPPVNIETSDSNDPRSYRVNCEKLKTRVGFLPKRAIDSAINDLLIRLRQGLVGSPEDSRYINIKRLREINLQ